MVILVICKIVFYLYNIINKMENENVKFREFNRTIDDPCNIQQRNDGNDKKMKFVTTNHVDLINAKADMNFFGMTVKDHLFVPSDKMDIYSELIQGQTGNIMTNCNTTNEYGQLPFPTTPSRYQLYHGDVDKENEIRYNNIETNRNTCNPRDDTYYTRYFSLFNNESGIPLPNALQSVETKDMGPRGGAATRFSQ